jgi:hypothetical protein
MAALNPIPALSLSLLLGGSAQALSWDINGHVKYLGQQQFFSQSERYDGAENIRLNANLNKGTWQFDGAVQSRGQHTDRLAVKYSAEQDLVIFGRDSISWGHGLFFNPVDVFAPFSPVAIDKEYKPGIDMLYWQHVLESGSDIQVLHVDRDNGDSDAVRYFHMGDRIDWTATVARHKDQTQLALGWNIPIGGALLSGDILSQDTSTEGTVVSGVVNFQHWFTWLDAPASISLEYFHNGFGFKQTPTTPLDFISNPELSQRLQEGELYTLGRDYSAIGVSFMPHPLWQSQITHILNMNDHSGLLYWQNTLDSSDNTRLNISILWPLGTDGREYTGLLDQARMDLQLQVQFAWYF